MAGRRYGGALGLLMALGASAAAGPGPDVRSLAASEEPVALVAACAARTLREAYALGDASGRAEGMRRQAALEGILPAVADATGVDRAVAREVLELRMGAVATRSLTMDPPGSAPDPKVAACDAMAADPGAYAASLRGPR